MASCRICLFCAALCLLSMTGDANSANATRTDTRKELTLLGLFPLDGAWPGGLGQLPAVLMGLEDVNNDPNVLPGYKLLLTIENTEVCRTVLCRHFDACCMQLLLPSACAVAAAVTAASVVLSK